MLVVLGELEMPVQFSGVGIQSEQAVAVKVVAGATLAAVGWRWIAGRPEELVGCWIIDTRHPGGRAANLPGVVFPSIMARFAYAGHGVKAPFPLARVGVVGLDKAANAVFAARDADEYEVLHYQRRQRKAVALRVVDGGSIPDDVSGFCVEGNNVSDERAHEELVAEDGKSTIHAATTWSNVSWQLTLI